MMSDAINKFAEQFSYNPKIVPPSGGIPLASGKNTKKIKKYKKYVLSGMGGSHLAADLARVYDPELPLIIRSDYGLPQMLAHEHKKSLFIANSHSGDTEEVVDALNQALKEKIPSVVISTGGKLIEMAKENNLPYIQIPNTGIQPRSALGVGLKALLKVMGEEEALAEISKLAQTLKPSSLEEKGKALAQRLKDCIPVIYSSRANKAIAYNWKIKFNETGKIPAFYNVFPELNHNEMTGFDVKDGSKHLSENFYFIILKDEDDHEKISKRMNILEKLYKNRGLEVEIMDLKGGKLEKIFNSLLLADWASVYTAENYGLESEQVPMVKEFKKMIE